MPWAIRVASAAPNTPSPSPATIQRSIKILRTDEKISSPSGILDSPMEVNIVERMLYINKNGKPTKYTRRYSTASAKMSAGVCNAPIIRREKPNPKTPRAMLSTRKLSKDVDTMVFILPYSLAPKYRLTRTPAPTPAPSATQIKTLVSAAQAPTAASAEDPTN